MGRGSILALGILGAAGILALAQPFGLELRIRPQAAEARNTGEAFWSEGGVRTVSTTPTSVADLADRLSPAVVNIQTERSAGPIGPMPGDLFEEFFRGQPRAPRGPRDFRAQSTGSGFVISSDGYIVTNHHVIDGAEKIVVVFSTGAELEATVVGQDPKTDLALVKVDADGPLEVAPLGDSDAVRVGDWVIAIGNPFGLDHTVTIGILSARGRDIGAGPYDDFLQTDASINPGNSGGPLIDMSGRVIGINTAINPAGQGIGFAIPINIAKELLPQLREHGSVTRGWLGVQIQRVSPALARSFGLDEPRGALVSDVEPGGPADKAKLQRGDVIVRFGDKGIEKFDDLPRVVAMTAPGSKIEVVVLREGKEKQLRVELGKLEEKTGTLAQKSSPTGSWGFDVEAIDPELADRLGLPQDTEGVVVSSVDPASEAAAAGLRPGDLVVEVNRKPVRTPAELTKALRKDETQALLLIQRGEGTVYLAIERK